MSWKAGVKTAGDNDFCFNALRFEADTEAIRYVQDLAWRWTAVRETTVVESDESVNYRFVSGRVERIPE